MNNIRKPALALFALALFACAHVTHGANAAHGRHEHSQHKAPAPSASSTRQRPRQQQQQQAAATYVCPMHADVTSTKPGRCPECGMDLKVSEQKTGLPPVNRSAGQPVAADKPGGANYFPNHMLLTHDNKPVRFYEDMIKGRVVLINFMFTTCAGVCPPMATNMAKVQSYLGDRVGKDVLMISISVDPTVDTPEKLKSYADKFKAKPGWYFLTGKKENVDWVLYKLGGYVEDKMQHSGVLIIGNDATGQWIKTAALRNPAQIAEAVIDLLKTGKK